MCFAYPVELENHVKDNCIIVRFPHFPEAITWGTTEKEALISAKDCLNVAIEGRMLENKYVPKAPYTNGRNVMPSIWLMIKLLFYKGEG